MLEISKDIKRRKLPEHIREGLAPFSIFQIKFMIGVSTFLLLDFIIIMPLLFPIMKPVLYLTLPPMAIMSVWALWLLFRKPENTEIESLLFLGFIGIVGSFCYLYLP